VACRGHTRAARKHRAGRLTTTDGPRTPRAGEYSNASALCSTRNGHTTVSACATWTSCRIGGPRRCGDEDPRQDSGPSGAWPLIAQGAARSCVPRDAANEDDPGPAITSLAAVPACWGCSGRRQLGWSAIQLPPLLLVERSRLRWSVVVSSAQACCRSPAVIRSHSGFDSGWPGSM